MDVTVNNFEVAAVEFLSALDRACFASFDCEFTGLSAYGGRDSPDEIGSTVCATVEEEYARYRQKAKDNIILQVGICLFEHNGSERRFTARPFNFNLFPRPINEIMTDQQFHLKDTFSSQLSSIRFLADHDFDFNKCFQSGISYMNSSEIASLRAAIKSDDYLQEDFLSEISSYLNRTDTSEPLQLWLPVDRTSMLVQRYLTKIYPAINIIANSSQTILITKPPGLSDDMLVPRDYCRINTEEIISVAIGFSRLFNEFVQKRIPVVGHNCLTDLCMMVQAFRDDLPENFSDFICYVHEQMFPLILDTKHIIKELKSRTTNFFDKTPTGLSALYDHLKYLCRDNEDSNYSWISKPTNFIRYLDPKSGGEAEKDQMRLPLMIPSHAAHEAGYDAWMTGVCLLRMVDLAEIYGTNQQPSIVRSSIESGYSFSDYEVALFPFYNLVNMISGPVSTISFNPASLKNEFNNAPVFQFQLFNARAHMSFLRSLFRDIEACEIDGSRGLVRVRSEHSKHVVEKALLAAHAADRSISFMPHIATPDSFRLGSFLRQRRSSILIGSGIFALGLGIGMGINYAVDLWGSVNRVE